MRKVGGGIFGAKIEKLSFNVKIEILCFGVKIVTQVFLDRILARKLQIKVS